MALKNISLFLDFPSECRFPQNPSSRRMQFFSNSGPFLSAFGVTWRFWAENAASIRPAIQHATGIVSDAAIRSCDWPAGRAAGAPCSPCKNAHAPRRSRSGRTVRRTRLLQLDCRSASTFQRGRSENGGHGLFQHLVDLLAVRALFVGCVARPELPVDRRGEFGQRRGQPP